MKKGITTSAPVLWLVAALGLLPAGQLPAGEVLTLYVGEVKVIRVPKVDRVAVGNAKLLSTSISESGQLILLAEGVGDTAVHIWNRDGSERDIQVFIRQSNARRVVYEIGRLLEGIDGLSVRDVGGRPVLEGVVQPKYKPLVDSLSAAYPDLLNMTRPVSAGQDKMVYMNVKITEFNTRDLQNLGIKWSSPIIGPSAAFAIERPLEGGEISIIGGSETPDVITPRTQIDVIKPVGYFGIATEITSRINYLVDSNRALILAEPRLSAKSGGEAKFLAGGEVPIKSSSQLGENVEFKEFGIKLNIKPTVDDLNNVIARVEVEISTIDQGLSVGGVPGFRSRKTATDISMRDGDTLVISGLVNREISKSVNKVKWLGDIPVLGALFRSTNFDQGRSELVIFVTPTIFDANSDKNREEQERRKRIVDEFARGMKHKVILD